MARDGAVEEKPHKWTSKYGSVVAAAYDSSTADGLNEKGLVVNPLYLGESQYHSGKYVLALDYLLVLRTEKQVVK